MYNMRDLMNPASRISQQLRDYRYLYKLAYGIPATEDQEDRILLNYDDEHRQGVLDRLVQMINDTFLLRLECLGLDMPDWQLAGAPDATTHQRWIAAGLLN